MAKDWLGCAFWVTFCVPVRDDFIRAIAEDAWRIAGVDPQQQKREAECTSFAISQV